MAGGLGSSAGRLSALLYSSYMRPPAFTFWSEVSGEVMGKGFLGPEPGLGVWWRFDFDEDVRAIASDDP